MELFIIIVSLSVIFTLIYGNSRLILISKNSVYNEDKYIQKLYKKQSYFFVSCDILVTMLEFLISAIVVEMLLGNLEASLIISFSGRVSFFVIKYLSILIITVISTYITMIIGIYLPRHIVHMRKIHKFNDLWLMYIYGALNTIFYPISFLALKFDTVIKEKVDKRDDIEEIKEFTNKEVEKGKISIVEKEIIEKTASGLDIPLSKVCTKMESVIKTSTKENVKTIKEKYALNPVSRQLVYSGKNIIGYIHIKDILLNEKQLESKTKSLKDIVRQPIKMNSNDTLEDALKKFKKEKCKMAIIYEENQPIGIITMGDILNKIVGKQGEV